LLSKWLDAKQAARRYAPAFYVRVVSALSPDCPAWPEGRGISCPDDAQTRITATVKRQMKGRAKPLTACEAWTQLKTLPGFKSVGALEFVAALRADNTVGLSFAASDELLVLPPVPDPVECVRQVLFASERPLPLAEVTARARVIWGERVLTLPTYRLIRMLQPEEGVFLLGAELYGLRKHIRLPESLWPKAREDVLQLLQREGWSVSTFEIIYRGHFSWIEQTNAYELAVVLRDDPRFTDLGHCLFALAATIPPRGADEAQQMVSR
jgi:hypothetical protein